MIGNLRNLTKYTSIALLVGSSFAMADCGNETEGNLFGYERCANEGSKFFTLTGNVETFTKAGFNGGKVDTTKSFYPTESFTSMFGEVNGKFNINEVYENDYF